MNEQTPINQKGASHMKTTNEILKMVEQYKEAAQLIEMAQAEQEKLKAEIRKISRTTPTIPTGRISFIWKSPRKPLLMAGF